MSEAWGDGSGSHRHVLVNCPFDKDKILYVAFHRVWQPLLQEGEVKIPG